ncbi:MAG TPA: polyprenyl diphosphate synthase [Longimicrobiales bacterium]|nr:polyprenyl diphosphate synthase [Longimicrobiales bacterium]
MDDSTTPADLLQAIRVGGLIPSHVAVIMDGNGRWARARGLPRFRGHSAGLKSVRDCIEGAIEAGVEHLTLFTFSQENWSRPAAEVEALMRLLQSYARREREELKRQGVEVHVFGDLDRLSSGPRRAVEEIQRYTRGGLNLRLNLMISYGGRAEIAMAARRLAERAARGELDPADIDESEFADELYTAHIPDPDLLIRTSGELRISNFLLWQLAYTELFMTPVLWPDFRREHLFQAIYDYQRRERRFGRVTAV